MDFLQKVLDYSIRICNELLTEHVEITQEDIGKGERRSTTQCPIASALSRKYGKAWVANYLIWSGEGLVYEQGRDMIAWRNRYDAGHRVEPTRLSYCFGFKDKIGPVPFREDEPYED